MHANVHANLYCNNCGKNGHVFNLCKLPITSIGIIAFRMVQNHPQYLMIRRKDTLGHIDFMRGKYSVYNKHYILNMLNQMTCYEKERIKKGDFDELWNSVWSNESELLPLYQSEENVSRNKFYSLIEGITINNESFNLYDLIEESSKGHNWTEPEWGFPKGRRNAREKDFDCAMREFQEETGFHKDQLHNIQNVLPFEEIFTGSNYKSYKHKYYVMYMKCDDTQSSVEYQKSEVSKMEWKTYEQALDCIRDYNQEKMRLLTRLHNSLTKNVIVY